MINFILLKALPYEIKLLIYVAVKNYHNRKIKYGFNNIINTIDELNNTVKFLTDKMKDNDRHFYFSDEIVSNLSQSKKYFLFILKWEKYLLNKFIQYHFIVRKIIFDCNEIRRMYGNTIYVYYYCNYNDKWIRFIHPLPYGSALPIRNLKRYHSILISHLDDLYDENIDPRDTTLAIDYPIFKFNFNELLTKHFRFSDKNKYVYKYIFDKKYILN